MNAHLRPLKRCQRGYYKSACGQWAFARHHSDPGNAKRWYVFRTTDLEWPVNEGMGHTTLAAAVKFVQQHASPAP